MADDVRVPLGEMSQAWSDIQSYTSNMWQLSALCITVIALSINVFAGSIISDNPPPFWIWQLVFLFALSFVLITIYTIQWLRSSIAARVVYIMKTEEVMAKMSSEQSVVKTADMFNVTEGPLKALLYFFYCLAVIISMLIISPFLSILVFEPISLYSIMNLIGTSLVLIIVLYSLYMRYRILRNSETFIGETSKMAIDQGSITSLRIAFTNTVIKQVFAFDEWGSYDVSIWHSKGEDLKWRVLTHSPSLPEVIRTMELPYEFLFEMMISPRDYEQYRPPTNLMKSHPLLGEFISTLADGAIGIVFGKITKHKLVIIIRETSKIYVVSKKEFHQLKQRLSVLIDEYGKDIFPELY